MPNRIIRESARTSPSLDRLSAEAERLFWRLVTVADDFGRFEADPRLILSACFPLRIGAMTVAEVQRSLAELADAADPIIAIYEVRGRVYGEFCNWERHNGKRAKSSKHPGPSCTQVHADARTCTQVHADAPLKREARYETREARSEKRDARPARAREPEPSLEAMPEPKPDPPGFADFWQAWGLDQDREGARSAWERINPPIALVLSALAWQLRDARWIEGGGRYRPSAKNYLERKRWLDRPPPTPTPTPTSEPKGFAALRRAQARRIDGDANGNAGGVGPALRGLPELRVAGPDARTLGPGVPRDAGAAPGVRGSSASPDLEVLPVDRRDPA